MENCRLYEGSGVWLWPWQSLPQILKFNLFVFLAPVRSCGSEEDHFSSSDEAVEADNEDENAAGAAVGTNVGWADAMAKVLSKKTPKSKSTILVKNKELEKEKEKLKQERLEKRKQVCPTRSFVD